MIIPYLLYRGDCEEAIHFYIDTFGGEILYLSRYTAQTGGDALTGKVMHVEAKVLGSVISAADSAQPVENRDAIRLMIHCATMAEADQILQAIGRDGEVLQRLLPHPPPDDGGVGGMVRDKYGYAWILTAPNERQ
ncbi:MAG: VOC family protein [Firmicutes bacterium]|nr:VOC family protein [Bacillota bacterium]